MTSDQIQGTIVQSLNLLIARRAATSDAADQAALDQAIDTLNGQIQDLDQADLQGSAAAAANAAQALVQVLRKTGNALPADTQSALQAAAAQLQAG